MTSDTTDIALTPELVRDYQESLGPGQMAGERKNCTACPLAEALHHAGATGAQVGLEIYTLDGCWENARWMPAWADAFIERIDKGDRRRSRVFAWEALRILDEVTWGEV